ncbi:SCLY [Symbiodinium natans]|uniref:SCLY protein n=1 Tax=Symbiodinium natans TaxID=878477 RepID=A0A812T259_9DINO|nr:SCLY [Symbiodinium natans]
MADCAVPDGAPVLELQVDIPSRTLASSEYFRYKHIFHKKPSDEDFQHAQKVAEEVRCVVCAKIVASLLARARSFSEDDIADVLEGNVDYERTGDPVTDQMLKHKRGCNKHFKDELVAQGYMLRSCREVAPDYKNDTSPCLWHNPDPPSQQAVDTYEVWKEGLFYAAWTNLGFWTWSTMICRAQACEQSVSRHTDALAEELASRLRSLHREEQNLTLIAEEVCKTTAKCDQKRKAEVLRKEGSEQGAAGVPKKSGKGKASTREL